LKTFLKFYKENSDLLKHLDNEENEEDNFEFDEGMVES
jgi:hypothetical protein